MERRVIRARGAAVRRRLFLVVAFLVPFAARLALVGPLRTSSDFTLVGFSHPVNLIGVPGAGEYANEVWIAPCRPALHFEITGTAVFAGHNKLVA
jgi:hypothetical protein